MTFKNILLSVSAVQASWTYFGFCPWSDPTPVGSFKPESYKGNWYEIYRDKDVIYEKDVECTTATYSINKDSWFYEIDVCNRKLEDGKASICTDIFARFDSEDNGHVRSWLYPEGNY